MKIKYTDLSEFSDIGTVVYYPYRVFYPESSEVSDPESLLKQGISDHFLYSTTETSEYTDFAKYDFSFFDSNQDYPRIVTSNLYNFEETLGLLGTIELDTVTPYILPGIEKAKEKLSEHYFGRLSISKGTVYPIYLPKNVWKLEIYNSKITSNSSLGFVDYDILTKLNIEKTESPIISIYFGPSYDTQIQDFAFSELMEEFKTYVDRYTIDYSFFLTEDEYDSFKTILSKKEYLKKWNEEIKSEKMFYIVNSSDNEISSINFYSCSYPESHNWNPHLNETTLRKDEYLNTTPRFIRSSLETDKLILLDDRSKTFLGLGNIDSLKRSWFTGTVNQKGEYSRSGKSVSPLVNGKTWKLVSPSPVYGENPEISPWWYTEDYLPKSEFSYYYITKTGKGTVTPEGQIYIKTGRSIFLEIEPALGYEYSGISGIKSNNSRSSNIIINTEDYQNGSRFEVNFEKISYDLDISAVCEKDYPNNYGNSRTYTLKQNLSNIGVELIYLDEDGNETLYSGESLNLSISKSLYIKFDTSDSYYNIDSLLVNNNLLEEIDGWYLIDISSLSITDNKNIVIDCFLSSKKFDITIRSASGIQLSTPRNNKVEYLNVNPKDPNYKDSKGNLVLKSRPFEVNMIISSSTIIEVLMDGVINEDSWKLEKRSGYSTLSIPEVKNNYEIIIR